jgi:hypothetical protein
MVGKIYEKSIMLALLEMLCSARIVNICVSTNKTYRQTEIAWQTERYRYDTKRYTRDREIQT